MTFLWMAALIACGDTKDGDTAAGGGDAADTELIAEAEAAFSGYESWEQIAPYEGIQPGESVHGSYVQIWYNDIAATTINAAAGSPLPVGSTIVKESYTDEVGSDLSTLSGDIEHQIAEAISGADLILFAVDCQAGITPIRKQFSVPIPRPSPAAIARPRAIPGRSGAVRVSKKITMPENRI